VVIEQAGRTLVTDPMLAPRMAGMFDRSERAPGVEALPTKIDAILITHFHYDHFSRWTLGQMDREATLVGPRRMAELYGGQFRRTVELGPWQSAEVGLWKITAVPAWHPTGRNPSVPYDATTTTGYVIEGPGPTVCVSGDSEYREHFRQIGRRFRIDLALVNVNNHLPGPEAARAVRDVGAAVWIPLHWGGYPMFDNLLIGGQLQALRNEQLPQGLMVWLRPGGEAARFMRPAARQEPGAGRSR
jgi:L-ascorbate metabolism protein UlaG (beta-lactamase superfamily)